MLTVEFCRPTSAISLLERNLFPFEFALALFSFPFSCLLVFVILVIFIIFGDKLLTWLIQEKFLRVILTFLYQHLLGQTKLLLACIKQKFLFLLLLELALAAPIVLRFIPNQRLLRESLLGRFMLNLVTWNQFLVPFTADWHLRHASNSA